MKMTFFVLMPLLVLTFSIHAADPHLKAPVQKSVAPAAPPLVVPKPDLTIVSAGFTGEFCTASCEPFKSQLQLVEIKCGWKMWIKNEGLGKSTPTRAHVRFFTSSRLALSDAVFSYQSVPALDPNQSVELTFPQPSPKTIAWTGAPIAFFVDPEYLVAEANEGNNGRVVPLR